MSIQSMMIFSKKEYDSFDKAAADTVNTIEDGDSLWLYVKLDKPLYNYVDISRFTDNDGHLIELHSFHIVIGPRGATYPEYAQQQIYVNAGKNVDKDRSVNSGIVTKLNVDPNTTTELKILLSSYSKGKSSFVLLEAIGGGEIGMWDNEIRLVFNYKTETFASAPILCNMINGLSNYKQAWKVYENVIKNGDEGDNSLPITGKFNDLKLKASILEKLKAKKGLPASFNFTVDDWTVYTAANGQSRTVHGYALYKESDKCYYTMIEVEQIMTYQQSEWSEPSIHFYKENAPVECN